MNLNWVKKSSKCLAAPTDLKAFPSNLWYMDSGCSRHSTGDISVFSKIESVNGGTLTYADGKKNKITGKGTVTMVGMPKFKNCQYVEGMKANLLSVSQFCDDKCIVMFTKDECSVWDSSGKCTIKARRTPNNLYAVISNSELKKTCLDKRKTEKDKEEVVAFDRCSIRANDRVKSELQPFPNKEERGDKFTKQVSGVQKGKSEHKSNSFNLNKPYEKWHLWDEFGDISSKCKFKLKDKNLLNNDCKTCLPKIPIKTRYSEKGNNLGITCHYCDRIGHSILNCFELTKRSQGNKHDICARTNNLRNVSDAENKDTLMIKRDREAMRIQKNLDRTDCT